MTLLWGNGLEALIERGGTLAIALAGDSINRAAAAGIKASRLHGRSTGKHLLGVSIAKPLVSSTAHDHGRCTVEWLALHGKVALLRAVAALLAAATRQRDVRVPRGEARVRRAAALVVEQLLLRQRLRLAVQLRLIVHILQMLVQVTGGSIEVEHGLHSIAVAIDGTLEAARGTADPIVEGAAQQLRQLIIQDGVIGVTLVQLRVRVHEVKIQCLQGVLNIHDIIIDALWLRVRTALSVQGSTEYLARLLEEKVGALLVEDRYAQLGAVLDLAQ